MKTMRTVQYSEFGDPDVLTIVDVPRPGVAAGEALVQVTAASVGGGEIPIRRGELRGLVRGRFPRRVGNDFVGTVASLGTSANKFKTGERVWGLMPHGVFGSIADYVVVPERQLSWAPAAVSPTDAAALPSAGTTALSALVTHGKLQSGERLLVRGGSGGVGSIVVQLGKALGAHVTAMVSARDLDWIRKLGADESHNYRQAGPRELATFDVIVDLAGTELESYRPLLRPKGRLVPLALDPKHPVRSVAYAAHGTIRKGLGIRAFSNDPSSEEIAELAAKVDGGWIEPIIDTVFPMDAIAEAYRSLEAGGVRGKHVIEMKSGSKDQ